MSGFLAGVLRNVTARSSRAVCARRGAGAARRRRHELHGAEAQLDPAVAERVGGQASSRWGPRAPPAGPAQAGASTGSAGTAGRRITSTTRSGSRIPGAIYDPGVTTTRLLVGGSTFTSGPAAVYGEQIAVGFQAGVNYINDHGGINGRRVVARSTTTPVTSLRQLSNTKRLVQVDKVFAMSMVYAPIAGFVHLAGEGARVPRGPVQRGVHQSLVVRDGRRAAHVFVCHRRLRGQLPALRSPPDLLFGRRCGELLAAYALAVKKDWEKWGVKVRARRVRSDQASCSRRDLHRRKQRASTHRLRDRRIEGDQLRVNAQLNSATSLRRGGAEIDRCPVIPRALGDFSIGCTPRRVRCLYDQPDYCEGGQGRFVQDGVVLIGDRGLLHGRVDDA